LLRYIAIVAVVLMVFGGSAYATPITPGGMVPPDNFTGTTADATHLLASHVGLTWSTPGSAGVGAANGSYSDAVYSTSLPGVLDFVYQFSNSSTSDNVVTSTTAFSFKGFCTVPSPCDVGFMSNGASLPGPPIFVNGGPPFAGPATLITLDSGGSTITFNMNVLTDQNILQGQTSEVLVIQAKALHYEPGMVGLIAGGTTNLAGFQPYGPEPSFFLPLGAGLLVAIALGRRKLAQRT
jgi:hypothetical protein